MGIRGGRGRTAIGLLVSGVALALVAGSVDLAAAAEALRAADARWLLILVAFFAGDVALRAVRWRILLAPIRRVPFRTTLAVLLVGYLANNILPARLGELVRSHALAQRSGLSRSTVLGTVVIERIVDTVVVVGIAAVAILVLSVRGTVASAVLVGAAVTGLLVVAVAIALVSHRLPGAERAAARIARWPRAHGILARLRDGLAVAGRSRTMLAAGVLSVGSWGLTVLAFAAAAQAVGVEPTIGQAALLAAGTNLATAIPSAPGYVGTFELAAVTIAGSVAIDAAPALAFAVIAHLAIVGLTSVGGSLALVLGAARRPAIPAGEGAEPGAQG